MGGLWNRYQRKVSNIIDEVLVWKPKALSVFTGQTEESTPVPSTTPIYNETTDLGDIEPVVYDSSLEDGQSDVELQEVADEQVDVETKDI